MSSFADEREVLRELRLEGLKLLPRDGFKLARDGGETVGGRGRWGR